MPIKPTDFHNSKNFIHDIGDIELEPIDPDGPGNTIDDMGCCRCLEPGQCEKVESFFGSVATSFVGYTAGALIMM